MDTTIRFIHRTNKKKGNFTQISNDIITDKRLGLKEKALIGYMLSKPDDWKFTLKNIIDETGQTRHVVVAELEELELYGYILRKETKNQYGRRIAQYMVKENPEEIVLIKEEKTIYRTNKGNGKFTQIDNDIIYNKNLSLNAKAVLIYMLSKPDTWRFYRTEIEESLGVSKTLLNPALQELEENGYIKREKFGKQYIWHVYEAPITSEKEAEKEKSAVKQHTTQQKAEHYSPYSNDSINQENCQALEISEEQKQENIRKMDNILDDLVDNMQNVVNFGYSTLPQPKKHDDEDMSWVYDITDEEIEEQKKEREEFWKQVNQDKNDNKGKSFFEYIDDITEEETEEDFLKQHEENIKFWEQVEEEERKKKKNF